MDISDRKLNAPFKPFNTLDVEYVKTAKKIALDYQAGRTIDPNELIDVRQLAAGDIEHLKGDFIISLFLEINVPPKQGKQSRIKDTMIEKILHHANKPRNKRQTVIDFCKDNRITRTLYYDVLGNKFKLDSGTYKRVKAISDRLYPKQKETNKD